MKFETAFDIGDKGWVMYQGWKHPQQVTIGQIRVVHTDSKGSGSFSFVGDNYKPQKGYSEEYMCDETGIGSGTVYTFGNNIFVTKEECLEVFADSIKKIEAQEREQREYEKQEKLRRESSLRAQLAEIERLKAEE